MIAGQRDNVDAGVEKLKEEFNAVLPFILQDEGYKPIHKDIDDLFDSKEVPRLSLIYGQSEKEHDKGEEERDTEEQGGGIEERHRVIHI